LHRYESRQELEQRRALQQPLDQVVNRLLARDSLHRLRRLELVALAEDARQRKERFRRFAEQSRQLPQRHPAPAVAYIADFLKRLPEARRRRHVLAKTIEYSRRNGSRFPMQISRRDLLFFS